MTMRACSVVRCVGTLLVATLCFTGAVAAQEGATMGIVTDSIGGALPRVTVSALLSASCHRFVAITDERGARRMPVHPGAFAIEAELQGFSVAQPQVELLIGQTPVVQLQISPMAARESAAVSRQAPVVDHTKSLGSQVEPWQMSEPPMNGRNFVNPAMPASDSRASSSPDESGAPTTSQVNVDGLPVTQSRTGENEQAKSTHDAIAEFEFVANRFAAAERGSSGTTVIAITESGTDPLLGSASGYFHDDRFVPHAVGQLSILPYEDQLYGTPLENDLICGRRH